LNISCLNQGCVELVNYTPNGDLLVVNSARCSFDMEHEEWDEEKDSGLIKYLAKHKHLLPFRHPSATIRIEAPIYVLRQLGKHQVGFSWSEVSRRYIKKNPHFHYPMPQDWRKSSPDVKQGSLNEGLDKEVRSDVDKEIDSFYCDAEEMYYNLLDKGVCPEQARMVLPQAMMTTTVTTGTLLGWHHMFTMRTEEHTQRETQEYAYAIGEILSSIFPYSWTALNEDYNNVDPS